MRKISPASYKILTRVFQADGFRFARQKGDHLIFTKPGIARPLVIPMYDRIPAYFPHFRAPDITHFFS